MVQVYSNWSEEEVQKFCDSGWDFEGWEDDCWGYNFLCSSFEKEWSCDELIQAVKKDVADGLTESEIEFKYYK